MIAYVDRGISIRPVSHSELAQWQSPWCEHIGNHFMQHPAWLLGAWNNFHQHSPGVNKQSGFCGLLATTHDGEFAGCSSWFRQFRNGIHWWKLVGSGGICSDYVSPTCRPEWKHQIAVNIAEFFDQEMRSSRGLPRGLEIEGHASDCHLWNTFTQSLTERGWFVSTVEIEGGWRLELPSEWSEYEKLLQKSVRRRARRAVRLLEDGQIELKTCRSPEDLEEMWPEFVRLHQSRRQQLGQPGCFADQNFERFLRTATLELAKSKSAWLSVLEYQSRPLAILLMFSAGEIAYMYQSGCDQSRMEMEPGHLVNAATIGHCISSGYQTFDFMRGDERYKAGWLASRIPLYRTRLFPPSLAGRGIASALKLRESLRSWL